MIKTLIVGVWTIIKLVFNIIVGVLATYGGYTLYVRWI